MIACLSSSEEGKFAFVAQPTTAQPVGTQSGKQYLWQYDQALDGTQQSATSGTTALVQAPMPLDKERQKEVQFDKNLKKNPSQGLNTPFCFDILTQLANVPSRITLHELLRLSKEIIEALRDALADAESFLTQVPSIPLDDNGAPCPQCHLVQQQVPYITFTLENMLLKDNHHD